MPILMKDIVPEGTFLIATPNGRARKSFSKEYLEKIATTGNKMLAAGLSIPAPFDHNKDALPVTVNDKPSSSYHNAGYWTGFLVDKDAKGRHVLRGIMDAPGSADDPATPYYKALNTAKEVSLSLRDKFQDGLGRTWEDALMHIALVNHAVVPDQPGFVNLVPDGSSVINMSMEEVEDDHSTTIASLIESLKTNLEITLPASTDVRTFLRDLQVAVLQIASRPAGGQTIEPVPVYMSVGDNMPLSIEQANSIVASKVVNPTTKLPYTLEDLGFKKPDSVDMSALKVENDSLKSQLASAALAVKAMMKKIADGTSKSLGERIQRLVDQGTISKDFAEKTLIPQVQVNMSIGANGEFDSHPLEITLSTLEAAAVNLKPQAKPDLYDFNGTIQVPALSYNDPVGDPDDATLQKAIEDTLKFVNI